ncbi:MAG TPA: hypothetical protein VFA16_21820 [Mycobacterium sp.]|uniref:hypothetical protein n=1 Tax=Mycobacterium sp. TaxID=1785 RepID=UPI002D44473E|nr:hypothetical protein [Mycobacterium sp.]HZU49867.1 hypothetical protein [Mycobacterium sp.]
MHDHASRRGVRGKPVRSATAACGPATTGNGGGRADIATGGGRADIATAGGSADFATAVRSSWRDAS